MDAITIQQIGKSYGGVVALHDISFSIAPGEFVTLLGPSGCGKTTTLRAIAGLERPDSGWIFIEGQEVFSSANGTFVPPEKRGLGMVFQSYAIWPHMTVFQNVAYGLIARKMRRSDIAVRVEKALEMVSLAGLGERPATKLSGGQQQRVALARSLVGEPRVLLLDEPLSNLDAKLRERMRLELKQLQRRIGVTTIYVTHDQAEALALSDRIIVMEAGRIVQQGDGKDIYRNPNCRFVVDFVGQANLVEGTITRYDPASRVAELTSARGLLVRGMIPKAAERSLALGQKPAMGQDLTMGQAATAAIRPEDIHVAASGNGAGTNLWKAALASDLFLGNFRELLLDASGHMLKAQVAGDQNVPADGRVWLTVAPEAVRILG